MRKHYERILHDSESRVQRYLDIQILDETSPFCGGFPKADSLAEPKTAIYRATTMTACYLNPESRYYLDAELGRRLALALAFVRRSQRPGGYFDLINCNFFSGPDTAFCTKRLLRLGIILLGFKLNLAVLFTQGIKCLPIAAVVVTLTIIVCYAIARRLGVDPQLAILVSGGTGICGAAAVMGLSGSIKVPPEQESEKADNEVMAVAIIAIMGTIFALAEIVLGP